MRKIVLFSIFGVLVACLCFFFLFTQPGTFTKIKSVLPKARINVVKVVPKPEYVLDSTHEGERKPEIPFRGLIESGKLDRLCHDVNKTIPSETSPPFYPYDGIGKPATIPDEEFGTGLFRGFCGFSGRNLSAIVVAYSAAQNFERRQAIRDTIGKQCDVYNCRLVFMLAVSNDTTVAEKLKFEYWKERDMFMKNKFDTYVDLNNKAVAMLDWLVEFCPEPKYVIHLIDDAFVNIGLYLKGLDSITDTNRYFFGKIFPRERPHRNKNSIYYVDPKVYPAPQYPDFIVGISYAFPNSLTRELRCAVHKAKYVWLEDVWLLGHIKDYLGLKLIKSPYESWHIGLQTLDNDRVPSLLYIHGTGVKDFYRFFKVFVDKGLLT